jgi:hypothetical protein
MLADLLLPSGLLRRGGWDVLAQRLGHDLHPALHVELASPPPITRSLTPPQEPAASSVLSATLLSSAANH